MATADRPSPATDRLSGLIGEFNFFPLRYLHPSRMEALPHRTLIERLRAAPGTEAPLNRHLLRHFRLEGRYHFDFSTPALRLALLDQVALERLLLFIGITFEAENLRKKIRRSEITQLQDTIGEDGYRFALKRAPFLPDPEFHPEIPDPPSDTRVRLLTQGLAYLARVADIPGWPEPVTPRVALKLPSALGHLPAAAGKGTAPHPLPHFLTQLIKEATPQWHSLFN